MKIIVSTGNIGFFVTRAMLAFGQFNYGKRGILDLTHTRLFTFASLRRLFEQNGFRLIETRGIPAPFPLAIKGRAGRWMVGINRFFMRLLRNLLSYQIFVVVQPNPALDYLLKLAETQAALQNVRQQVPRHVSD